MTHVFISYVSETLPRVERLARELESNGLRVWLDKTSLQPGLPWKDSIRRAIQGGDFFLACFSAESGDRSRSYMNEELSLAIEELRLRPRNHVWFIPILFSGEIPNWDIDGRRTLRDLQWIDLTDTHWMVGLAELIAVLKGTREQLPGVRKAARIEELSKRITAKSDREANYALMELIQFSADALTPLKTALKNRKLGTERKTMVLGYIGQLGEKASPLIPLLIPMLGDEGVGMVAMETLVAIGPSSETVAKALINGLEAMHDWDVQEIWLAALKQVDHPLAQQACAIHQSILNMVGNHAKPLTDKGKCERYIAAYRKFGEKVIPYILQRLHNDLDDPAIQALKKIGRPAVPWLLKYIARRTIHVSVEAAAIVLGSIADPRAVPALGAVLAQGRLFTKDMIFQAAQALARIGTRKALQTLRKAQSHQLKTVRDAAENALNEVAEE